MNQEEFWNWINSLNPIVIDVDKDGNLDPQGVEELKERLTDTISDVRKTDSPEETNG